MIATSYTHTNSDSTLTATDITSVDTYIVGRTVSASNACVADIPYEYIVIPEEEELEYWYLIVLMDQLRFTEELLDPG